MVEDGERYSLPCYVGVLHAYDGEINLAHVKNLLSNEFAVKMCLEFKEKDGEKVVKRELLVSLKGEFYFVKFIINPEEDDTEPCVILGRSFIRLAKGVVDFVNGIITVYPDFDIFCDGSEKAEEDNDDSELMFDLEGTPEPKSTELRPYVCNMGKSARNKKRALESFQIYYPDEGPSRSSGKSMTQEEVARQELAFSIYQKYELLEEYKLVLDGMIEKKEEEAIIKVKGSLERKRRPRGICYTD
ncbi:hypothetical protein Tco_0385505 [Tanacetum coccineum]